ncbi:MAG: bifunctional (p)ppGpp synthetase/guanosine-3',5'-bis(diphosphate) 3'-pyrophosphohydrolase, partial [Armatimonadetes bacterium]|nr:bifunctional (p)ppGpp synthetase/guanosine-3',5'-bis(diphosphate) 3'-pyrophosphohydrolase [Armatimonadota bacterium]
KETSAQGPPVVSLADGFHGRLARCCNPVPGDPILGYVTRGSGIAVHRADCNNILYRARREPERVMTLRWSDEAREQAFRVWVEVVAVDRRGLLSHIAAIVSDAGINIHAAEGKAEEPGLAKLWLEVEVSHRAQLTYLLDRLQAVADVVSAREVPAHVRPAV